MCENVETVNYDCSLPSWLVGRVKARTVDAAGRARQFNEPRTVERPLEGADD